MAYERDCSCLGIDATSDQGGAKMQVFGLGVSELDAGWAS